MLPSIKLRQFYAFSYTPPESGDRKVVIPREYVTRFEENRARETTFIICSDGTTYSTNIELRVIMHNLVKYHQYAIIDIDRPI